MSAIPKFRLNVVVVVVIYTCLEFTAAAVTALAGVKFTFGATP